MKARDEFCEYGNDPDRQFIPAQQRMAEQDRLNPFSGASRRRRRVQCPCVTTGSTVPSGARSAAA